MQGRRCEIFCIADLERRVSWSMVSDPGEAIPLLPQTNPPSTPGPSNMQEEADAFTGLFDAVKKVFEADVDSCRPVRDMSFAQELVIMPPFRKDAAVNAQSHTPPTIMSTHQSACMHVIIGRKCASCHDHMSCSLRKRCRSLYCTYTNRCITPHPINVRVRSTALSQSARKTQ